MSKEEQLWKLAKQIIDKKGDLFEGYHFIETSDYSRYDFKVYISDGYCLELSREYFEDSEYEDGYYEYSFSEPWDGFKVMGIDEALERFTTLLKN